MRKKKGQWTLYIHKNKVNRKVYIGITSRKPEARWGFNGNGYKPDENDKPTHFWLAIQKYGWDNFEHQIILTELFKEEAELLEQQYIQMFDSYNDGYNSTLGGSTGTKGYKHTDESKRNMVAKRTGRKHAVEWCKHISDAQRCKRPVICLETGKIYADPQTCSSELEIYKQGILDTCRGVQHTVHGLHFQFADAPYKTIDEIEAERKENSTKRKIICLETGEEYESVNECCIINDFDRRIFNHAVKRNYPIKGYHYTYSDNPITLNDIGQKKKETNKVRCIETGMVFQSVSECADFFNTSAGNISTICSKKEKNYTIRGYHLEYIDYKPHKKRVICEETNQIFSSQKECAKYLGVNPSTVYDKITFFDGRIKGQTFRYYDEERDGKCVCQ